MSLFTRLSFVGILTAATIQAQAQAVPTFTNPTDYNNYIVNEQRLLLKKNLRYISKSAHSENERKIESRRLDVVKQNELSLARLAKLKPFEGDDDFKDKATEALYQQLKVYSEDYKNVDFLAATRTRSYENMEQYYQAMEMAEAKLQAVGDSVDAAQKRFAKRHKLTISKDREMDELDKYIAAVSAVNAYQHKVYLAQFRIEKANARVSDAMSAQDVAAFAEARKQLAEDAKTAQAALSAIPAFRGKDTQYRDATRSLVNFYAGLAANQFLKLEGLLDHKDSLSKEEVKEFNGYINYYNANSQKFSQAYNQAANNFQSTYIPVFND
ncbi:hypothetical protein GCM10023185_23540 [Hymenobacter saemangeumensis]|uniref:DUF3829 domain-containing protein n=1 Tax=Hymenobacter saemangeumensis TaxID=1084522 RepID=A0ABP8IG46_9BACT